MHSVDFLIIGQGLAGSLLAYSLIKRGCTVHVLDNDHESSSSRVAAGLINPVTGHRLNITDGYSMYRATAQKLYWQIERDLGCDIHRQIRQTRKIKNAGQADYLVKRQSQTEYSDILGDMDNTGGWFEEAPGKLETAHTERHFGAIGISQTSVVDTKQLLYQMSSWLTARRAITKQHVIYSKLLTVKSKIRYDEIEADRVIFCEGHQALNNPWLSHLPFKLAKGEILSIKPSRQVDRMLSWGHWLVPALNGACKLGSNYIWNDISPTTSAKSADKFLLSLEQHTGLTAHVISHESGVRPATTQRDPFVGPLTNLPRAFCLNGLGSKGCLIAPHFVTLLCDHLLEQRSLPYSITQWL